MKIGHYSFKSGDIFDCQDGVGVMLRPFAGRNRFLVMSVPRDGSRVSAKVVRNVPVGIHPMCLEEVSGLPAQVRIAVRCVGLSHGAKLASIEAL